MDKGKNLSHYPMCVIMFSGKRKSGKDYITELLLDRIGKNNGTIVRLSAPIKSHWAQCHSLDLSELLNSSSYKEQHRLAMIKWSEEERAKDYGHFCNLAVEDTKKTGKPVWIVSDARRKTDLQWFREQFGALVKTVRVSASDDVRKQRGWIFTEGVDDVASECNLDDIQDWDWVINNNGGEDELVKPLLELESWVQQCIS